MYKMIKLEKISVKEKLGSFEHFKMKILQTAKKKKNSK